MALPGRTAQLLDGSATIRALHCRIACPLIVE
jgi:hypothetical protein